MTDLELFSQHELQPVELKAIAGGRTCTGGQVNHISTTTMFGIFKVSKWDVWDSDSVAEDGTITYENRRTETHIYNNF